jgi:hypothetical protein
MLEAQSKELVTSDTLLLGRVTYEEFVAAWPLRSGDAFTEDEQHEEGRGDARPAERLEI